jgi:PAS domain S-box-containing protein
LVRQLKVVLSSIALFLGQTMTDSENLPESILLVDDNPDDRLLVLRELNREFPQLRVIEVFNLDSLNRELETEAFDLVITDYELQWANGIEVLQRIKERDRNTPVVMFTNSGSQEIAVEAMKSGLDDYVLKSPRHLIRLTQAVRSTWRNAQIRRQAERLESRLQSLLDRLSVGVFRSSSDGRLEEVNNGFLRILGLTSLDEAKSFFSEQFGFAQIDRTSGEQWERELQLRRPDGEIVWVKIAETPIEIGNETVIDGLLYDISEQKQTSAMLEELNQTLEGRVEERTAQLETSNQELEIFITTIAHDVRAPIRQIGNLVGFFEMHLRSTAIDETSVQYLQRFVQLSERANQLIENLLEYWRTGRFQMQYATIDMNQLVQEVRQSAEELLGREIVWNIESLPLVWGDRTLLHQVWQNLIDNALKYTRLRQQSEITIGSRPGEGETIFFIRDNGVGFDMRERDRLFQIFQRLSNSDEFEGTGLGLANVQRIIHRHQGRVWAESAIDRGATFYFSLPDRKQN